MSATIFVCPQSIDKRRRLWNHETPARWQRRGAGQQQIAPAQELCVSRLDANAVVAGLKTLPETARDDLCARLRMALRDSPPGRTEGADSDKTDREQSRQTDSALITIRPHSLSHPILTTLRAEELARELRGGRFHPKSRLDRSTPIFRYPNAPLDARVRDGASRHDDAAVSSAEALIDLQPTGYWALPGRPVRSDLGLSVWCQHSPQS